MASAAESAAEGTCNRRALVLRQKIQIWLATVPNKLHIFYVWNGESFTSAEGRKSALAAAAAGAGSIAFPLKPRRRERYLKRGSELKIKCFT